MPDTGRDPEMSRDLTHPPMSDREASRPGADPESVAEELVDTAERLIGEEVAAWAALKAEVENRINRREQLGSSGADLSSHPRAEPDIPGPRTGGAMTSQAGSTARPRRPFTGFDRERATYERHKPALLEAAEGKFVVIVGDEMVGPLESVEAAERAGYERFGLGPLYIKQVLAQETPALFTRDVVPCRI